VVNRSHTAELLDALFGEDVEEPRQHSGDEQLAQTPKPRGKRKTLTRRDFLTRLIRLENNNG
jgi:hypothetical protein